MKLDQHILKKEEQKGHQSDRRKALKQMAGSMFAGMALFQTACSPIAEKKEKDAAQLKWEEFFKGHYRLMTPEEKKETVDRLTKLYEMRTGERIEMSSKEATPGVLYGYAFNISRCKGYLDCIDACVQENNQDRESGMQYIRIFEKKKGAPMAEGTPDFLDAVPNDETFYMGTQCYHCANPPCTKVCPVEATWQTKDGLVVIDYDWCIGCRYCMAACPYDGRRFNWSTPQVPKEEVNKKQHYLGNRLRKKGIMEKCTFCIQRAREGKNTACVEACTTGARVFGNLLDKNSEIRWIIDNKKVFRMKEDLGTEPKFWYYMD